MFTTSAGPAPLMGMPAFSGSVAPAGSAARASTTARASSAARPSHNHLLAALPDAEFAGLAPHLEPVKLALGQMLYEPGQLMQYAYFPTSAVVSLHYVTESGAGAESAGVGNEGVVGISLFMGGHSTPSSAVVQTAGQGFRLDRHHLMRGL